MAGKTEITQKQKAKNSNEEAPVAARYARITPRGEKLLRKLDKILD